MRQNTYKCIAASVYFLTSRLALPRSYWFSRPKEEQKEHCLRPHRRNVVYGIRLTKQERRLKIVADRGIKRVRQLGGGTWLHLTRIVRHRIPRDDSSHYNCGRDARMPFVLALLS